jgi:hypothetical protein
MLLIEARREAASERERVEKLEPEIVALKTRNKELELRCIDLKLKADDLNSELSAFVDEMTECICGCSMVDHDTDEDWNFSCKNRDHKCYLVKSDVAKIFSKLREQNNMLRGIISELKGDKSNSSSTLNL